ncbi:hypothetical protein LGM85_14415 [Burkholderia multivorans]|uniref:Uncharacterized protein n=1 Tax=Burkholderia multivorans TaxID=87883 RepID=A0AAP2HKR0_9BURK|nr:hypothetical protein [Burkholderia multivorans]MBU9357049.1 hypothetical protein [Burkholderia multivorans]MBU9361592.1 hypothetical protein [Burkholderia multivorans]MBU9596661.1 hypothetical protein [Burkholderia multivorans]MCA8485128.1 hypothetical protein [Burkholderia multivorans]
MNPLHGRALHFVPSGAIDAATCRVLLSAGDGAVVSTLITAGAIFQRPCVRAANLVVSSTAFLRETAGLTKTRYGRPSSMTMPTIQREAGFVES